MISIFKINIFVIKYFIKKKNLFHDRWLQWCVYLGKHSGNVHAQINISLCINIQIYLFDFYRLSYIYIYRLKGYECKTLQDKNDSKIPILITRNFVYFSQIWSLASRIHWLSWLNKSLQCSIKLSFFPKSEHKFPFPASLWHSSQYWHSLGAFSSNITVILVAPSSPIKCSSNLVSHIAQSLCPLPGKSQSNLDLKEEEVVFDWLPHRISHHCVL